MRTAHYSDAAPGLWRRIADRWQSLTRSWRPDLPEFTAPIVPPISSPDGIQRVSEFIFNARLNLFNTRREHEWRVIIGALVLLGAVDYTVIEHGAALSLFVVRVWQVVMVLLFLTIT